MRHAGMNRPASTDLSSCGLERCEPTADLLPLQDVDTGRYPHVLRGEPGWFRITLRPAAASCGLEPAGTPAAGLGRLRRPRSFKRHSRTLGHGTVLVEQLGEPVRQIALDPRGRPGRGRRRRHGARRARGRRRDLDRGARSPAPPRSRAHGCRDRGRRPRGRRALLLLLEDARRARRAAGRVLRGARPPSSARCSSSAGRSPGPWTKSSNRSDASLPVRSGCSRLHPDSRSRARRGGSGRKTLVVRWYSA